QNEFKCLTLKESLEKDNWILQYLSGHYHKKSQTFYVKMLGDSYTIEAMYRVILLKGLMKGKYIEYLK
ncbi:MAG: hypothetical protein PWQ52_727, partial [Methanolobus sp.]|nr:hypothetical protein [Methanolobus sp.]